MYFHHCFHCFDESFHASIFISSYFFGVFYARLLVIFEQATIHLGRMMHSDACGQCGAYVGDQKLVFSGFSMFHSSFFISSRILHILFHSFPHSFLSFISPLTSLSPFPICEAPRPSGRRWCGWRRWGAPCAPSRPRSPREKTSTNISNFPRFGISVFFVFFRISEISKISRFHRFRPSKHSTYSTFNNHLGAIDGFLQKSVEGVQGVLIHMLHLNEGELCELQIQLIPSQHHTNAANVYMLCICCYVEL